MAGWMRCASLILEGTYRTPLQVSPDGTRLAYLAYDPNQPSLTAGFCPAQQPPVDSSRGDRPMATARRWRCMRQKTVLSF